jgi:hypothetical protein
MTAFLTTLIFLVLGFVLWSVYVKPEPKPKVKKEPLPTEPLVELHSETPEELFALALGDLEFKRLEKMLDDKTLIEYLKERWEIELGKDAKAQTIYALQQLWSEGSVELLLRDETMRSQIAVKSMIAFDSSVYAELIRQTVSLGILTEEASWGLLFLNAQRVQDSFDSWQDYQEAYIEGVAFWLSTRDDSSYKANKMKLEKYKIEREWLSEPIFSKLKIIV